MCNVVLNISTKTETLIVSYNCLCLGKSPYLLFTNRHEIRRIDLVKRDYSQVVSTQKNAVALDLDVANNRIFWCDRFHRKIYRYRRTET